MLEKLYEDINVPNYTSWFKYTPPVKRVGWYQRHKHLTTQIPALSRKNWQYLSMLNFLLRAGI